MGHSIRLALSRPQLWLIACTAFIPLGGLWLLHIPWIATHSALGMGIFWGTQLMGFFGIPTVLYHRAIVDVLGLTHYPVPTTPRASSGFQTLSVLNVLVPVVLAGSGSLLFPSGFWRVPGTPYPFNQPPTQGLVGLVLLVWLVIEPWTGLIIARNFLQDATRTRIPIPWRASTILSGYLLMLPMAALMGLFCFGTPYGVWMSGLVLYLLTVWYSVIIMYHVTMVFQPRTR